MAGRTADDRRVLEAGEAGGVVSAGPSARSPTSSHPRPFSTIASRSMASSSRTLPGQLCVVSARVAAGVIPWIASPCRSLNRRRQCSARSGRSSRRSLRGGTRSTTRGAGSRDPPGTCRPDGRGQVPVRRRDQPDVDVAGPARADRPDLAVAEEPEERRLSVGRELAHLVEEDRAAVRLAEESGPPLDRAGERPALVAEKLAPEQLPVSAPQFTASNRARGRRLSRWMAAATSSLPVPVSPRINTGTSYGATRPIRSKSTCIAGLRPISPSNAGSVSIAWGAQQPWCQRWGGTGTACRTGRFRYERRPGWDRVLPGSSSIPCGVTRIACRDF